MSFEHALGNFSIVVKNEYNSKFELRKLPVYDYTIETDEGIIDTLYLAVKDIALPVFAKETALRLAIESKFLLGQSENVYNMVT